MKKKIVMLMWMAALPAGFSRAEVVYYNDFHTDVADRASVGADLVHAGPLVGLDRFGRLVPAVNSALSSLRVKLSDTDLFSETMDALRITAVLKAPVTNRVGIGFASTDENSFTDPSADCGPWLQVNPASIQVRGGTATAGSDILFPSTHSAGDILQLELTFYSNRIDITLNGTELARGLSIAHADPSGNPSDPVIRYLQLQFFNQPADGSVYFDRVDVEAVSGWRVVRCLKADYGAACDGSGDDSQALKQALEDAAASTAETFELHLPENTVIRLNSSYGEGDYLYTLPELSNFSLDGSNATFLVGTGVGGELTGHGLFFLENVTGSRFRNFNIDYEEAPWSQGEIVGLDAVNRKITLRNDAGYMAADDPRLADAGTTWMTLHSDDGLLAYSGVLYVTASTNQGEGCVELDYTKWPAAIDTNTCTRYVRVWRNASPLRFSAAENVVVDNIHIYASPGVAVYFLESGAGNAVLNCNIEPPEGSGRMISCTAGGISFFGGAESGPLIESNRVIKVQDDAIQIHSGGTYVYEASGNAVRVQRLGRLVDWEVGDWIGLYNFNDGTSFTAQIVNLTGGQYPADDPDYPGELYREIMFDIEIPSGFTVTPVSRYADEAETPTIAYDMSKRNDGAVIRNNTVEYTRARGLLLDGHRFLVQSNTVSHTVMPGIYLGGHFRHGDTPQSWLTSFIQEPLVEGNTLRYNQHYGGTAPPVDRAAIFCGNEDHLIRTCALDSQFNENITIRSNRIEHCGYSAVRFANSRNGKVIANVFDSINRLATGDTYAIEYQNCADMDEINVSNTVINCTVTQDVRAW